MTPIQHVVHLACCTNIECDSTLYVGMTRKNNGGLCVSHIHYCFAKILLVL